MILSSAQENSELAIELGKVKHDLMELKVAFERRNDFICWLLEIKLDDEFSMEETWDEFDKYQEGR